MFHPCYTPPLTPMPGHIQHNLHPHRHPLKIRQIPIPLRIRLQPFIIQLWHPPRVHRNHLILLVPMPHKTRPPLPLPLLEEEEETTIAFSVHSAPVYCKALRGGCFHLGDGARTLQVGGGAVDSVHDGGATVHAGLGGSDEVGNGGAAGLGGVDEGVRVVEDGFEVFPFTVIARGF